MLRSLAYAMLLAIGSVSNAPASTPKSPEAAVRAFYGAKRFADTQLKGAITPRFYSLLKAANRYQAMCWCADVLDTDPFIRAQMGPRSVSFGRASLSGVTAIVPMTQYYGKPRVLHVHMQNVGGMWLIADVTEGNQSSLAELAASVARAYAPGRTPDDTTSLLYFWASRASEHGGFWANLGLPKYVMTPKLYGLLARAEQRRETTHAAVLDYDPFSNARVAMSGSHFAKPVVSGTTAVVMVTVDHKSAPPSQVKIVLRRVAGGWLVDDVVGSGNGSLQHNLEAALR